jgi:hypothetical protein
MELFRCQNHILAVNYEWCSLKLESKNLSLKTTFLLTLNFDIQIKLHWLFLIKILKSYFIQITHNNIK